MLKPEVLRQPPAKRSVRGSEYKDLPCNGWTVCINAGKYDSPLEEFRTETAAKRYYDEAAAISEVPIEMIPSHKVRRLQGYFVSDDILIHLEIK